MASAPSHGLFSPADLERFSAVFAQLTVQLARLAVEFGMLMADPVFWGWGVQHGDGHSVLALPGLGGGDGYLQPLRTWLWRVGYHPVDSGLEVNPGWSEELLDELAELIEQEFRRSRFKLTTIGHSLGGVLSCALAAYQPHMIRQVITLASPLRYIRGSMSARVPITAFRSRADSIVRYPGGACLGPACA
jgi:pimeloyl-ACP methyl ester carboxylesterase